LGAALDGDAKRHLDVFDGSPGAVRRIDNLPAAVDLLIVGWAGLEATGHYDKGLRGSLSDAGIALVCIYAHVLTGAIRSVVGTEPAKVFQAGESFHEEPGAHHRVSENASETQPASLLAVFIVDAEDQPLTTPDSNSDTR
jgi:Cupin domain